MKTQLLKLGFITLSFLVVAVNSYAQVADKKSLTLEGARQVIKAAKDFAEKNNAPGGVIAVVDDGGSLIALERLDGTFTAGANISIGKAKTAVMFKRPTKVFEDIVNKGRTTMVALQDFTPLQGGVPITIEGQIVGAIGVSGAASAQQDEEIAMAGANFMNGDTEASTPVKFFESRAVSDAFAKGAVLVGEDFGTNYMIHASRREKEGASEIHATDTDIIYVLEGTAVFVTGGKSIDSKQTAENEFRGTGIEGGTTYNLKKGDVIVVPKNTPHWFKQTSNPFLYYVVKVR